jgi:hypothetical protein
MSSQQWQSEPEMQLDLTKKYQATLRTSKGDIVIDLFSKNVPTRQQFCVSCPPGFL